jgi:hypothetical protein
MPTKIPAIPAPSGCSHISAAEAANSTTTNAMCPALGHRAVTSTPRPPRTNTPRAIETANSRPTSPGPGREFSAAQTTTTMTSGGNGRSQRTAASCWARAALSVASVGVITGSLLIR